jgi:hypothetical protein
MLAEQVWVVSGAEDGALAGGQAWEGGEGGEALGLGEQGGGAEAGLKTLRAAAPSPLLLCRWAREGVDRRCRRGPPGRRGSQGGGVSATR